MQLHTHLPFTFKCVYSATKPNPTEGTTHVEDQGSKPRR